MQTPVLPQDEAGVVHVDAEALPGTLRIAYGLAGMILFLFAVVGLGLALFTWIGSGSAVVILYDLASGLATAGLGYLFLTASANGRRLVR